MLGEAGDMNLCHSTRNSTTKQDEEHRLATGAPVKGRNTDEAQEHTLRQVGRKKGKKGRNNCSPMSPGRWAPSALGLGDPEPPGDPPCPCPCPCGCPCPCPCPCACAWACWALRRKGTGSCMCSTGEDVPLLRPEDRS